MTTLTNTPAAAFANVEALYDTDTLKGESAKVRFIINYLHANYHFGSSRELIDARLESTLARLVSNSDSNSMARVYELLNA